MVRPRSRARALVTPDGSGGDEPWILDPDGLQPVLLRSCPPIGDCRMDFQYRDELLLDDIHAHGGRVWIPEEAREKGGRYPLLVLLHGIDTDEEPDPPHRLLAPPLDVSRIIKRRIEADELAPMLVAAPSQTRDADSSVSLWTAEGFELGDFVQAVDRELAASTRVRVDRHDVSVFGHSGAGCVVTANQRNGLFHIAEELSDLRRRSIWVRLLGLMDICFHGHGGGEFLAEKLANTDTKVFAMWVEPEAWSKGLDRDLDGFARGLGVTDTVACDRQRYESCHGNPAGWFLYKVHKENLQHSAPHAAVDDPDSGGDRATLGGDTERLDAHHALVRWFVDEALNLYF
ncbi:MAG: hypothetical protein ABI333_09170 [bacterium]